MISYQRFFWIGQHFHLVVLVPIVAPPQGLAQYLDYPRRNSDLKKWFVVGCFVECSRTSYGVSRSVHATSYTFATIWLPVVVKWWLFIWWSTEKMLSLVRILRELLVSSFLDSHPFVPCMYCMGVNILYAEVYGCSVSHVDH